MKMVVALLWALLLTTTSAWRLGIRPIRSTRLTMSESLQRKTTFFNSLTRTKETFQPCDPPTVRMYSCGPTVYDLAHIGNFRAFLTYDLIKRWLIYCGYEVDHVCNLTDVDDKIIARMVAENKTLSALTEPLAQAFFEDLKALNVIPAGRYPRATEHIPQIIQMVEALLAKGHAYVRRGSVYFNVSSFPSYGALGYTVRGEEGAEAAGEARRDKADQRDFALWKARSSSDGNVSWPASFGEGRPGWHIECSAMACHCLGPRLDIHAGGVDLRFPHHANEIAQSEACTGQQLSRLWMHNGFVTIRDEKMSKSRGNFVTLRDLARTGLDVRSFRLLVLSSQYRHPLHFSEEAFLAARSALQRIDRAVALLHLLSARDPSSTRNEPAVPNPASIALTRFEEAMADDLHTPQAMVQLFSLVKWAEGQGPEADQRSSTEVLGAILCMDTVLGLLYEPETVFVQQSPAAATEPSLPLAQATELAERRLRCKLAKDFAAADLLRAELRGHGYTVADTVDGFELRPC